MDDLSSDTIARALHPLKRANSEAFVQNVMRAVRALDPLREAIPWRLFARWAFPALGFFAALFAVLLNLSLQPGRPAAEMLLWGDPETTVPVEGLAIVNDDPIPDGSGMKP